MPDKREEIIESLKREGLNLTFSSPKITGVRKYYIISEAQAQSVPSFEKVNLYDDLPQQPQEILPDVGGVGEEIMRQEEQRLDKQNPEPEAPPEEEAEAEPDFSAMSPKEFKKYRKEKEREAAIEQKKREKEEKEFNAIRKDAHKRGYDTSVLMQLESPEQLYEFSDQEIDQIQAAGYINDDGFYDFVYPPDSEEVKREPISSKTILLVVVLVLFVGGMLAWMFTGISSMF